jgi:hypothetical protein
MTAHLVTGNPGAGKTALVAELTGRGVTALDADELAGWESPAGELVVAPPEPGPEWLARHRWVWPRSRLEQYLRRQSDATVVVCGIAMNQRDLLDLFDSVFLLSIDEPTQLARLAARGTAMPRPGSRSSADGRSSRRRCGPQALWCWTAAGRPPRSRTSCWRRWPRGAPGPEGHDRVGASRLHGPPEVR